MYSKKERKLFHYWINKQEKLTENFKKEPRGNSRDKSYHIWDKKYTSHIQGKINCRRKVIKSKDWAIECKNKTCNQNKVNY